MIRCHVIRFVVSITVAPARASFRLGINLLRTNTDEMMAFAFLLCLLLPLVSAQPPHDKRNVLLIIGDDAGFELGAYNNTVIKTPNFDRLARRGLTLTRGYAATSTCSPSRAAILTGLPQHQMGQYGLYNGPYNFHTFDSVQSLPVILSKAGMYTGIVGKKHVGPSSVYKFDFEKTEENCDEIQVTRNITLMKEYVNEFLRKAHSRPFYLHIGFKDPHRAMSRDLARYGQFSQRFGNGQEGMGTIPDWQPAHYSPSEVVVPPYLPDNLATREDIANQYTSISRLDAGVGMLLNELKESNHLDNTLIIYCGDNGIPFVHAKTNLYEMGIREPMIISSPHHPQTWGTTSSAFVSTLDFLPTILDWCSVPFPQYDVFPNKPARLSGKSLLPLFSRTFEEEDGDSKQEEEDEERKKWKRSFSSQSLHEITMFYPMRAMREGNFHLIHNLNYQQFFPIATDLVVSPTFLQLLEDTKTGSKTGWIKTLDEYYYRPEWELYNVEEDPLELHNLASDPRFADTFDDMKSNLREWQHDTFDPWICYPDGVLFNNEVCIPILNSRKNQSNHSETEKDEL